eukprot:c6233_g1_i1.p1 GENE.c6233_g1_i1~~c6233_g1_i1.p1  ORF type:complete len:153 (-),score=43.78 c6233_g1_i1:102-560(-)
MRFVVVLIVSLSVLQQILCVPLSVSTPMIEFPHPKNNLPINDPNVSWDKVFPSDSKTTLNMLQEDEGDLLSASSPTTVSCSVESGCACRHHYYFNHIDTQDCKVFVPSQYFTADFKCQFFVQGGYLFLYGNAWKKARVGPNPPVGGDTYFCS